MSQLNRGFSLRTAERIGHTAGECDAYHFATKGIMACCQAVRKYKIKGDSKRNVFRGRIK